MTLAAAIALALCFLGMVTFLIGVYLLVGPVSLVVAGTTMFTLGSFGVNVERPPRGRKP